MTTFKFLNKTNSIIPYCSENCITGSQWINQNINLIGAKRNENIIKELSLGNIPDFLRDFSKIDITINQDTITYFCMPDYLCIGSNDDYIRIPTNPITAQMIANQYDCTLPTRKMCLDIYNQSTNKLPAKPWGPPYDADMERTHRIKKHSETIDKQIESLNLNKFDLSAGHKKDVVLTNKLYPSNKSNKVAIYGWFKSDGKPIQGLNSTSHSSNYEDYSHGIRLIANDAFINGKHIRMIDVFSDINLSKFVSDEGVLKFTSY